MRVAALFSSFLIPVGGQNFPLHRLRELIVEADAVGVHHRHVPLFQHAVPAGIFQQRRDIRRNKVFLFAPAHDERALPLDREQGIREIPEQDSQRIAAPHHGQSGAQSFEGLTLIAAVDELDQDLGVGLALKGIALGHKPLLQHTIVLDDAVVDDAHPGRGMRVAVHIAGLPMGRPPGVADAAAAPGQSLHRQPLAQLRQTTLALDHPDAALQSQGHTGGIIAAVLQLFQTIQQNILCIPFSNITNNATHTKHLHADSPAQKRAQHSCQPPVTVYVLVWLSLRGSVTVSLPIFAPLCGWYSPWSAGETSAEIFDDSSPRHPHGCHPCGPALCVS